MHVSDASGLRLPLQWVRIWAPLALLAQLAFGCSPETTWLKPTQVVVRVQSDFAEELTSVDAEIYDEAESTRGDVHHFALDAELALPFSLVVVPPRDSARDTFLVLLRGRDKRGESVETKAVIAFEQQKTLEVELWLRKDCLGNICPMGQSCRADQAGASACVATETASTRELASPTRSGEGDAGPVILEDAGASEPSARGQADASAPLPRQSSDAGMSHVPAGAGPLDGGAALDAGKSDAGASSGADAATPDAASFGKDGDPSAPVIALGETLCRSTLKAETNTNFSVNTRPLILDYPCGKHDGAAFTLIVNLHATVSETLSKYYLRDTFPAYTELSAQNLIIATPAATTVQWGNGDSGLDAPFLLEVVSTIVKRFSTANIRSIWFVGHSWGGFFVQRFICDSMLSSRVRGIVLMGANLMTASCNNFSVIAARGSDDTGSAMVNQATLAAAHGCTATVSGPELVGGSNERRYYSACQGYVHEDYQMIGKTLTSTVDAAVVAKIIESMKGNEH
jgi:hypothetical protein